MSDESGDPAIGAGVRPRLAAKARVQADRVSGEPVVLYPEGALLLNPTGASIVGLCDGCRTFAELVDELAARYNALSGELAGDVGEYLIRLRDHGLMELQPAEGGPS
jgi:pyrroloquinoline quinone biosynthesis protein D